MNTWNNRTNINDKAWAGGEKYRFKTKESDCNWTDSRQFWIKLQYCSPFRYLRPILSLGDFWTDYKDEIHYVIHIWLQNLPVELKTCSESLHFRISELPALLLPTLSMEDKNCGRHWGWKVGGVGVNHSSTYSWFIFWWQNFHFFGFKHFWFEETNACIFSKPEIMKRIF